ncbi:MAG: exlusion protein FxsA [Methylophilaceae bacterium]|nr:MAG: exlusion protein FxsA [Methylophilaceae bacterium]
MRLFIPIILLGFLVTEVFLLITLGQRYGIWLLIYLVLIGYLGLQLIRGEKQMMSAKMMQSLKEGGNPLKSMMGTARNMVAGVLLMVPGVITDVIAALLLLIPIKQPKVDPDTGSYQTDGSGFEGSYRNSGAQPANDDVIEGEFEEIKEPSSDDNISSIDKNS